MSRKRKVAADGDLAGRTRAGTCARESQIASESRKPPAMKRTILHLVVALFFVGSVRADPTIQSVQQALKDQGFYYGSVTGEKSAETIAALRRYQIRNGLQITGEINPETLRSLKVSPNSASSPALAPAPPVTQPRGAALNDRSRLGLESSPHSFGESGGQLESGRPFIGTPYESTPPRMNVRIVAEVQRQLASRGYYRGWIDGRYGRRTAFALRVFQVRSGLPPTGRLDMMTLDALGLSDANLAYLEPAPRLSEAWVPVRKFKHGKWKVKWKKYHRDDEDAYVEEHGEEHGEGHGHGHDDD